MSSPCSGAWYLCAPGNTNPSITPTCPGRGQCHPMAPLLQPRHCHREAPGHTALPDAAARPLGPIMPPTWKRLLVAGSGTPFFLQMSRGGGVPVAWHRSVTGWRRATVTASPSAMLTEGRAGQRGNKVGGELFAIRALPYAWDREQVSPKRCAHLAPKPTPAPGPPRPGCCPGRRRALGGRAPRGRSAGSRHPRTPLRYPLCPVGTHPSATCEEQGGVAGSWGVLPPPTLVSDQEQGGAAPVALAKSSDHGGERDPRDEEQEWMPPILKDTPSQGSPLPRWSPHPDLCCIFACRALGCPQGAVQPPKAAQGDMGRTPILPRGAHRIRGMGTPLARQRMRRESLATAVMWLSPSPISSWGGAEKKGKRGQQAGINPGSLAWEQPRARRAQDPSRIPKPTAVWGQIFLRTCFSYLRKAAVSSHLLPAAINPSSPLQPRQAWLQPAAPLPCTSSVCRTALSPAGLLARQV